MKIYVGQSRLTIFAETKADLTDATFAKIKFIRPDQSTGEFTGTISGTKIEYNVQANDLNQAGEWTFYSYVTYNDSRISIGEAVKETIYTPGE